MLLCGRGPRFSIPLGEKFFSRKFNVGAPTWEQVRNFLRRMYQGHSATASAGSTHMSFANPGPSDTSAHISQSLPATHEVGPRNLKRRYSAMNIIKAIRFSDFLRSQSMFSEALAAGTPDMCKAHKLGS